MGRISDADFLSHQAYLGSGYSALVQVESVLESGLRLVVSSTDRQVEIDMIDGYVVNLEQANPDGTAALLRDATMALQHHITERTGQTFNDFLFVNGLQVSKDFADLSETLGVPISPANIE